MLAADEPQPVNAAPLPNSAHEALTAIDGLSRHRLCRHGDATRQAVLTALPEYPVGHFSCHGYANIGEPLASGLLMANDELLTLRDFLELRLVGMRLAILSACETAIPGFQLPDEVVSLPTGLLQAGVAGIVASLWSVSGMSTMMLLARFYEVWGNTERDPAEALRRAQQWVRDTTNGQNEITSGALCQSSRGVGCQRLSPARSIKLVRCCPQNGMTMRIRITGPRSAMSGYDRS
jgi:CHAT domain-containing protein